MIFSHPKEWFSSYSVLFGLHCIIDWVTSAPSDCNRNGSRTFFSKGLGYLIAHIFFKIFQRPSRSSSMPAIFQYQDQKKMPSYAAFNNWNDFWRSKVSFPVSKGKFTFLQKVNSNKSNNNSVAMKRKYSSRNSLNPFCARCNSSSHVIPEAHYDALLNIDRVILVLEFHVQVWFFFTQRWSIKSR